MKSGPIIVDIAKRVNIWEEVRQELNRFGKRLIIGRQPASCRIEKRA